jgi:hypothetical protein
MDRIVEKTPMKSPASVTTIWMIGMAADTSMAKRLAMIVMIGMSGISAETAS